MTAQLPERKTNCWQRSKKIRILWRDSCNSLQRGLYDSIDKKMKTSTLSSIFKVYNDKEMASEYNDYTTTIKKWEDKLSEQEDYYYKKFSAMETALAKLNSQTSSLSGLFGS